MMILGSYCAHTAFVCLEYNWYIYLKCLSGVWGFYIFEIFRYSWEKLQPILSAEKFIFIYFFAVKVDGYDVKPGICLYENPCTDSWVDVTSVNFNSKKVLEDKIFGLTRYITILLMSIRRFQICKIPKPWIYIFPCVCTVIDHRCHDITACKEQKSTTRDMTVHYTLWYHSPMRTIKYSTNA